MIKFIDKIRRVDDDALPLVIVEFENDFWDNFIILRMITGICLGFSMMIYQLLLLPFVFLFSTLDWILEGAKWGYNRYNKITLNTCIEKALKDHSNELDTIYESYTLHLYNHDVDMPFGTFIHNFIRYDRNEFNTINKRGYIVCDKGRRRSAGDIYLICKSYYPNCTFDEVMKELIMLCINRVICGSYCSTINKYVFHIDSHRFIQDHPVEYMEGITFKDIMKFYGYS